MTFCKRIDLGGGRRGAFFKSKKHLQDSSLLVHYDLKKPLLLACDASPYGVGAVISHFMENARKRLLLLPLELSQLVRVTISI